MPKQPARRASADLVVLYARISEDAGGQAIGVTEQLRLGREHAARMEWTVVAECSDNDISALTGLHRPGYQQVLQLLASGQVGRVVCFHTSRLWRNRVERATAITDFGRLRVVISAIRGPEIDLTTAYGRGQLGLMGEFDTMESEVKSERVTAAAAERARAGLPSGSLGYGWAKTGTGRSASYVEHPEQAPIVREIVRRLLAGESLLGVTADLNRRGVPGPGRADRWAKTSVKKIALRHSNAALRVHHKAGTQKAGAPKGELWTAEDEEISQGTWPALVTEDQWRRVVRLLTAPERRVNASNGPIRPGARKHLLTGGVGHCGVCGGILRAGKKGNAQHGVKQWLYLCAEKGCVGRNEGSVDELVAEVVLARLARPDALDWLAGDDDAARAAAETLAGLRARLGDAADDYADGKIERDQLARITARLQPQITKAEAAYRAHGASTNHDALLAMAGTQARARWNAAPLTVRRGVVEALICAVTILPTGRRGPGFDPSSVRIEWVGAAAPAPAA